MKRFIKFLLAFCILLVTPGTAWSEQGPGLLLNGKFFPGDAGLRLEKGITMVQIRPLAEALGAEVNYRSGDYKVTVKLGNKYIIFTIGSNKAVVNGQEVQLARPTRVEGGRTQVPLRAVAEALNYNVTWNAKAHLINLSSPDAKKIAFGWRERDGQIGDYAWQDGNRNVNGDWYKEGYSKYMDFAVITAADQAVSMPPLKTLAPIWPPREDYDKYLLLFAYLGEVPSGGYGIYVEEINQVGQEVLVRVRTVSPEPGQIVTQALDYPYEYVRLQKDLLSRGSSLTFTFVDQKGIVLKQIKREV